jgi:hypothetical protein
MALTQSGLCFGRPIIASRLTPPAGLRDFSREEAASARHAPGSARPFGRKAYPPFDLGLAVAGKYLACHGNCYFSLARYVGQRRARIPRAPKELSL